MIGDKMGYENCNLEASEEKGMLKELKNLKTYFEIVIRSETQEVAIMKANGIKHLHPSLEIRECIE